MYTEPERFLSTKTEAEFNARVSAAGDKLLVIWFFASWCPSCKTLGPVVHSIGNELADKLTLVLVDIDHDQTEEVVCKYQVDRPPFFVLEREGTKLSQFSTGYEAKLRERINNHL